MKYIDYLSQESQQRRCGFCDVREDEIIAENDQAYATPALAPYGEFHILVCIKDHIESFLDLDKEQRDALMTLSYDMMQRLYDMGASEVVQMMRDSRSFLDGMVHQSTSGKSRKHFHIHIVGDVQIMPKISQEASDNRLILTPEQMVERARWYRTGHR